MKKDRGPDSISTFIGVDAFFKGHLNFKGTIRVDGKVQGEINSADGTVIIGEKATVEANLTVGVAIVMGTVSGSIDAANRIEVCPPARITGDLKAPVISIEPGGMFNGSCAMTSKGKTPSEVKIPSPLSAAG
jgi:cytoskeletal protein CcmA (bactofilin family)